MLCSGSMSKRSLRDNNRNCRLLVFFYYRHGRSNDHRSPYISEYVKVFLCLILQQISLNTSPVGLKLQLPNMRKVSDKSGLNPSPKEEAAWEWTAKQDIFKETMRLLGTVEKDRIVEIVGVSSDRHYGNRAKFKAGS